jgi:putative aldouronate transport system substrate-binding protein
VRPSVSDEEKNEKMRTRILTLCAVLALAGLPLFAEGAAEGAAGERTTLTVELFDRGNMEGNSLTEGPITQYILEHFAEPNNIDFQWKVLPRGEEESGLTLWMAAGDAPDLSFTYSWPLIFKFVQDGGVRPVDDLLEQHGQELAAWLGDHVLSYGQVGGVQYAIPSPRETIGNHGFWVRKDWLDAVGLDVPETADELHQALLTIKQQDPGNLGGDLVPMAMNAGLWGEAFTNLMSSFIDPSVSDDARERAGYGWRLYPGNTLMTAPGYLDGLRFLNKLHNEGLFHPDWALDNYETRNYWAHINAGRAAVFSDQTWTLFSGDSLAGARDLPGAEWWPFDFRNADGKRVKQTYTSAQVRNFIPATSSDPSAINVIKYLTFLIQDDPQLFLPYGETRASGGDSPELMWFDKIFVVMGRAFSADTYVEDTSARFPEYAERIRLNMDISVRDGRPEVKLDGVSETEARMQGTIREKQIEWVVRIIAAAPEDVDGLYARAVEELDELGAGKIYEELTALYDQTYGN